MRADLRAQIERDREQYGRLAGDALLLCDPSVLGDSVERKIYVEGAAQMASSVEFTNQDQLRELLEAIEEKDRLIALLSGCIESPEPVHVELGLDKMSSAGKHLALVSASYSANDQVQGTLGILAPMRMHYERVITAVAFMAQFFSENNNRGINLRVFLFQRQRKEAAGRTTPDEYFRASRTSPVRNEDADPAGVAEFERDPEAAGSLSEQIAEAAGEKQELMNTLVRRQADFENYRKRVEKERHQERHRGVGVR